MTSTKPLLQLPPVCVNKVAAAAMLGMSLTSFEKYVMPNIKVIRLGSLVLVPVAELGRWAAENADYTLST